MKAIVVGATGGLGSTVVRQFLNNGWDVYGVGRSPVRREGPRFTGLVGIDLRRHDWAFLPPADALVLAAGHALWGPLEATSDEEFRDQLDVMCAGPLRVIRAVLPGMRAAGHGSIIAVGSTVAPAIGASAYAAGKAALREALLTLAVEVEPFGIHVALVEPGKLATGYAQHRQLAREAGYEVAEEYYAKHGVSLPPKARIGEHSPDQTAWLIVHLAAGHVSGVTIRA